MKSTLNSVSIKIKYVITLLAALFIVCNIIYIFYIYMNSTIYIGRIFKILAFTEIILILFISTSLHHILKSDPMLKSIPGINRDEISEDSSVLNVISDGIIVVDRKGRVRTVNRGLCYMMGLDEKEIVHKSLYNILNEQNDSNDMKLLPWIVIESLETQKEFKQVEKVIIRDKELLYLTVSTYILKSKNKCMIGVLAVVQDSTQKKALEQQLLHAEKLATAGQMAAELAHEIKNPICSIKGLIQIIGKKHGLEGSKHFEVITSEIDRISVLLQGFLTLSQNKPKLEKVSIKNVIEEIYPLIESYAGSKNISIRVDMQKKIPVINADKDSIRQVIINIVQNGIDALPVNGRINLSIWYDQINDLVKMEFKDNGTGIKPEYLDKIFEPFFTTKKNGSGLGLAISHKIIESHHGKLFAFNNLDGGATFAIELPAFKCCEINNHNIC